MPKISPKIDFSKTCVSIPKLTLFFKNYVRKSFKNPKTKTKSFIKKTKTKTKEKKKFD